MRTLLQIFWQSLVLSFAEIRAAKLRSFLSLLGITIGILCIISVRTAVSSLEINVKASLATIGNDIIYIAKWPWIFSQDYPWWKYLNRPVVNRRELELLQERTKGAEASCIMFFAGNSKVLAGDRVAEGVNVSGMSYDYNRIKDMEFTEGRYFTPTESANSQAVAIIGANVAETLFGDKTNPEGQQLKINGVKVKVIGVLKREGSDLFGLTLDNNVIVPFTFMSMFVNMNGFEGDPLIAVIPKKGVPVEELKYELRGVMRSIRRLPPTADDNFAINQVSVFADQMDSIMGFIDICGIIIGMFSIAVGGFGIANIMFVAVKERTYIIGIKKAIGARRVYILLEFLLESVVLCLIGGVAGLIVVIGLIQLLQVLINNSGNSFQFHITAFNMLLGLSISVAVGIIAGFIPAWSASKMKPVDAIRST